MTKNLEEIRYYIPVPLYEYLESLEAGAISVYGFQAYGADKEEELGAGTVIKTGKYENGFIEVEVTSNSIDPEAWVGDKFFVTDKAKANNKTFYKLYTDAGTTDTGMYVKIREML